MSNEQLLRDAFEAWARPIWTTPEDWEPRIKNPSMFNSYTLQAAWAAWQASAALTQPAEGGEVVAWRTFDGEGGYDYRDFEGNENYASEWERRNHGYKGWVEPLYTTPPASQEQAQQPIKDHQIARIVNQLRDIAIEFGGTQQLRERIAGVIVPVLKAQQPATATACGIPGMAKTTCPYCDQEFTFEHEQPATPEPVASRNPFASRCYTMSESHLSGHRLIVGFEKLGDAQDAHEWVARQARGDFTNPAPSVPATGESIGQVFYAADGGDETGVGYHMKPYVHWFSKASAAAADTKLYTRPVPSLPDSITTPTEDGTEYDYSSGHAAKQDAAALNWIERQYLEELGMGLVIDAPNDGKYYVCGDSGTTHYGKTLREAVASAIAEGV